MEYLVFCLVVFFVIVLVLGKWFFDDRKAQREFLYKLKTDYGKVKRKDYSKDRFLAITKYFSHHEEEGQVDDITWNDLSGDELFNRLNVAHSSAGEEYLYYLLRSPMRKKEELAHFEELVEYFEKEEAKRIEMQLLFKKLGFTGRYSMYDYLDHLDVLGERKNTKHYITIALYFVFAGIFFINETIGVLGFLGVMFYAMFSYFADKGQIEPYITSFAYLMHMQDVAGYVVSKQIPGIEKEREILGKHRESLKSFKRGAFWLMSNARMSGSGNPLDVLFDYVRMTFHFDLIKFNNMLMEVKKHIGDVDVLFKTLGELECAIMVGDYRASLEGQYCLPQFVDEKELVVEDLVHPLLSNPVANSVTAKRGVLLTGSNASGKSTFLKSVALAALMGQTIHTVAAKKYQGPAFLIMSSMALSDNLLAGESYYIVEIRSIKRILDVAASGERVLCFVDEVLRGTNTVERIAASCEILKSFARSNVICFAATHDIELTDLLQKEYDNYHFEEEIKDGDVVFNYRLQNGKASTRNAIKLLSVMGYEEEIINHANVRAQEFIKTGIWK